MQYFLLHPYLLLLLLLLRSFSVSVDYEPLVGETLSFGPGDRQSCATIVIIDDDVTEPMESFVVFLEQLSIFVTIDNGGDTFLQVTITDDDSKYTTTNNYYLIMGS